MSETKDIVIRLADALLYESWGETSSLPEEAAAEICRLRSLNAEMVEALTVFDDALGEDDDGDHDGAFLTMKWGATTAYLTVAALRRARAALTRATKESDNG